MCGVDIEVLVEVWFGEVDIFFVDIVCLCWVYVCGYIGGVEFEGYVVDVLDVEGGWGD